MNGRSLVYNWLLRIHDLVAPRTCLLCGAPGADGLDLCSGCAADLPRLGTACSRCGEPIATAGVCGACRNRPPPFSACIAPFRYAPPLDHLIIDLKFRQRLAVAHALGNLLGEAISDRDRPLPGCLVPVPLHPGRLRERGFNQALELTRPLARRLGLPISWDTVHRTAATDTQSRLTAAERRRNVRRAFTVDWPRPPKHVAVVDDVLSTGSTAGELARALLRAGVREVEVWVVAKAVKG